MTLIGQENKKRDAPLLPLALSTVTQSNLAPLNGPLSAKRGLGTLE